MATIPGREERTYTCKRCRHQYTFSEMLIWPDDRGGTSFECMKCWMERSRAASNGGSVFGQYLDARRQTIEMRETLAAPEPDAPKPPPMTTQEYLKWESEQSREAKARERDQRRRNRRLSLLGRH